MQTIDMLNGGQAEQEMVLQGTGKSEPPEYEHHRGERGHALGCICGQAEQEGQ